jgi:hypothetical protein
LVVLSETPVLHGKSRLACAPLRGHSLATVGRRVPWHDGGMVEQEVVQLRARVALLERQLAFVMRHLGVSYTDQGRTDVSAEVVALVRNGNKIGAIKLHQQQTGVGLADAKKLVDTIE